MKQDKLEYKVVINHEEQYSIWPHNEPPPKGWQDTRINGNLNKCHEYIREVWTDMRPLSLRKMKLPKNTLYAVIINHEEQFAIWPNDVDLPKYWKALKVKGNLDMCTEYIEEVWTDMRPLSLRNRLKSQ